MSVDTLHINDPCECCIEIVDDHTTIEKELDRLCLDTGILVEDLIDKMNGGEKITSCTYIYSIPQQEAPKPKRKARGK